MLSRSEPGREGGHRHPLRVSRGLPLRPRLVRARRRRDRLHLHWGVRSAAGLAEVRPA